MIQIGSVPWRILNYGPNAALKYSLHRLFGKSQLLNYKQTEFSLFQSQFTVESFWNNTDTKYLNEDLEKLRKFFAGKKIKNVFDEPSFTRIVALCQLLKTRKYNLVIETGTQNGISSSLMQNFLDRNFIPASIHTFDVIEMVKEFRNTINYHTLTFPGRRKFINLTGKMNCTSAIFFHDSDHSKENMEFELNYAWRILKVSAIVCDDVQSNNAFLRFVKKTQVKSFFLKLDHGPMVGIILRN